VRILTSAEMAAVDRAAQRGGIPSRELMERAAEGIVEMAHAVFPGAGNVAVICGPGNNGGDGLAVARLWRAAGADVRVLTLEPPGRLRGDARANWDAARAAGVPATPWPGPRGDSSRMLARADLIVDALFGTGLSRALSGAARRLVEAANGSGRPILAIDVPSGLSGDSGDLLGPSIAARWTGAVAALKRCHVLHPARERCGEIAVIDIGIPDALVETRRHRFAMIGAPEIAPLFPRRRPDAHKGDFGHVAIVAGSRGKAGAALLCGSGALRAGSGLVTIAVPGSIEGGFVARLPEAMTLPLEEEDGELSPRAADAVAELLGRMDAAGAGPGLGAGRGAAAVVAAMIGSSVPAVFDADALNLQAGNPEAFRRRRGPTILTPHPGEAGRLLGRSSRRVQADRAGAAAELARRARSVVILKGAPTITADPSGMLWCNSSGSPALSKGGSGDVLTGIAASFLGQGLDASDAAVAAAFVHGLAGEAAGEARGERGALASETADSIGRVLQMLERA
jgi:hydroxyethylthiazole kinase-like uncharacterized protein yjeF